MDKLIRFNDTLRLSLEQGFPRMLDINKHLIQPFDLVALAGQEFYFKKPLPRLYPLPPTRTFLVQDVGGFWLPWGHCLVTKQTITDNGDATEGTFRIIKLYPPDYMQIFAKFDVPEGKNYFDHSPSVA